MAFRVAVRANRLVVFQPGLAAVKVHKIDDLLINVVLALVLGRLVVLLLAHLLGFHGVEAILGKKLSVHAVCTGGEGLVA